MNDIEREIKVRDAIKYCIENFDSKTATNRIVEFWKDELELQQKQCNIAANVSNSADYTRGYRDGWRDCCKDVKEFG